MMPVFDREFFERYPGDALVSVTTVREGIGEEPEAFCRGLGRQGNVMYTTVKPAILEVLDSGGGATLAADAEDEEHLHVHITANQWIWEVPFSKLLIRP